MSGTVMETAARRRRRKFAAGVLEQGAQILGAIAASVLVVGLVGPYVAAFVGSSRTPVDVLRAVALIALAIAGVAGAASMVLRGLARHTGDDPVDPRDDSGKPLP